jgi:hypothetical protein
MGQIAQRVNNGQCRRGIREKILSQFWLSLQSSSYSRSGKSDKLKLCGPPHQSTI